MIFLNIGVQIPPTESELLLFIFQMSGQINSDMGDNQKSSRSMHFPVFVTLCGCPWQPVPGNLPKCVLVNRFLSEKPLYMPSCAMQIINQVPGNILTTKTQHSTL